MLAVGLVVRGLANVGPLAGLRGSDDELREGVVGAGRAGDSEEGGECELHLGQALFCNCSDAELDGLMKIRGCPRSSIYTVAMTLLESYNPGNLYITVQCTLVWYFILRTQRTRRWSISGG